MRDGVHDDVSVRFRARLHEQLRTCNIERARSGFRCPLRHEKTPQGVSRFASGLLRKTCCVALDASRIEQWRCSLVHSMSRHLAWPPKTKAKDSTEPSKKHWQVSHRNHKGQQNEQRATETTQDMRSLLLSGISFQSETDAIFQTNSQDTRNRKHIQT